MSLELRRLTSGVKELTESFDQFLQQHNQQQVDNPYSESLPQIHKRRLSRSDSDFSRPAVGSSTARRASEAQKHVLVDMRVVCEHIWDFAAERTPEGKASISFGKLFRLYLHISDKVVGTLLRARKRGFVDFEGEMLYQKRDDHKMVSLTMNINTILAHFEAPPRPNGGEVNTEVVQKFLAATRKKTSSEISEGDEAAADEIDFFSEEFPEEVFESRRDSGSHIEYPRRYSEVMQELETTKGFLDKSGDIGHLSEEEEVAPDGESVPLEEEQDVVDLETQEATISSSFTFSPSNDNEDVSDCT